MGKNSKKNKRPNQKSRAKKHVYLPEIRGIFAVFMFSKTAYRMDTTGWKKINLE